jgi:uncharacterized protein (TIGR00369 family)
MRELPHTASCFVCGESNVSGLKIRFETNGENTCARFVPRLEHIGFKQTVHGGILATLLDEIMVWACAVRTRRFSYCAELTVRYQSPVRPGEEVLLTGELVANRRNKLFEARGEIRNAAGRLLATATGKYLPIKEIEARAMLDDFIGDTKGWFDAPGS